MQEMKYKAALYCRLSQEDKKAGESESISTQKSILTRYANENDFEVYDIFCDDGFSGTNFERPEFQRMIDCIESGEVNTVICKDLSRFGREYAYAGVYVLHYFEKKSVRFISVSDNFDSDEGIDTVRFGITNVMNTMYARDTSQKTKAGHRTRALDGKFLGTHAPYGYIKNPDNRHHLIIDQYSADITVEIFNKYSEGKSIAAIIRWLEENKVLAPTSYQNVVAPNFENASNWKESYKWNTATIKKMLKNEVYLGHIMFGKTKQKGFYDKTRIKVDRADWIICENMHEPIITMETLDMVQKLLKSKRRTVKAKDEIQHFSGLLKCADCGKSMIVTYNAKRKKYTNFQCRTYKVEGKANCPSHGIGWNILNQLVIEDINRHAHSAKKSIEEYKERLASIVSRKQNKEIKKTKEQLVSDEERLKSIDIVVNAAYEEKVLGKMTDDRYRQLCKKYEIEENELRQQIERLKIEVENYEVPDENINDFTDLISKYTDIKELDFKILNELIDKIYIHEKVTLEDGSYTQAISIHYRFIGKLEIEAIKDKAEEDNILALSGFVGDSFLMSEQEGENIDSVLN